MIPHQGPLLYGETQQKQRWRLPVKSRLNLTYQVQEHLRYSASVQLNLKQMKQNLSLTQQVTLFCQVIHQIWQIGNDIFILSPFV